MKLEKKLIGKDKPCYIIAEAGVNHILNNNDLNDVGKETSLDVALKMVDVAFNAGADAIKFQSFTAENLQYKGTIKPQYQKKYAKLKENYYELIKKYETSKKDQEIIAKYCLKKGITFLSTPYDIESAKFLNDEIKVPFFKLASIELNNHLFIKKIAKFGKKMFLSTGLSSMEDVNKTINFAKNEGFLNQLILLQCTSDYPVKTEEINLNVLKTYYKKYPGLLFGFSDHSSSDIASIGAVALGAVVLEKHFTLNKNFEGPDHKASLSPEQLHNWIKNVREVEKALGSCIKKITLSEKRNFSMRKFLIITSQKAGSKIKESYLKTMRTGKGVLPIQNNLKKIIGKKLLIDINKDTPFNWNMINNGDF